MNAFDQMRDALAIANNVQRAADNNANQMANMLMGRLRHVDGYALAALKRELQSFDMRSKCWRRPK
jgi:hypothetical protein